MSKRVKMDINGNLKISILPSELKLLHDNEDMRMPFYCYCRAIGEKDKEVVKYYEHSFHGTKYQSLFQRNVGD